MSDVEKRLLALLESYCPRSDQGSLCINFTSNSDKCVFIEERRTRMNSLDLSSASEAAHFIVETAAPYVAGKITEGMLREVGKETFQSIRAKAESIWRRLKNIFASDRRLLDTLENYEAKPADPEAKAYLEGDLSTYFAHHGDELTKLLPDLKDLLSLLPAAMDTRYAPQSMTNVKDSKPVQSQGNGTIIIN